MLNTDREILDLIAKDESFEKGFYLLVNSYKEKLYWHIRRMVHYHEDTDDVLQNVFIKVFKNIRSFEEQSKLYTWLYRIATNETLSFIAKRKKRSTQDIDELDLLSESLKADVYFDGDEARIKLKQAIETLPNKQRLIFNMRYFEEMPYKDISEVLKTSVGALKASYHHAVKKIENYLKEYLQHV